MIWNILGIVLGGLGIGSLITFFVKRHDDKKGIEKLTQENAEEIKKINGTMDILKDMCLGSLYDRTKYLGEVYIRRGNITLNEYNDWCKYLFEPYHRGGGDGTIDKIKAEVDELPIVQSEH